MQNAVVITNDSLLSQGAADCWCDRQLGLPTTTRVRVVEVDARALAAFQPATGQLEIDFHAERQFAK